MYQQLVLSNPNDEMANEQMNVLYKTEVGFQISFSDWSSNHKHQFENHISFVDHGNSDNANTLSDVSLPMGEFQHKFPENFKIIIKIIFSEIELKPLKRPRHNKYKTELCLTFHAFGFCPYGSRVSKRHLKLCFAL